MMKKIKNETELKKCIGECVKYLVQELKSTEISMTSDKLIVTLGVKLGKGAKYEHT